MPVIAKDPPARKDRATRGVTDGELDGIVREVIELGGRWALVYSCETSATANKFIARLNEYEAMVAERHRKESGKGYEVYARLAVPVEK